MKLVPNLAQEFEEVCDHYNNSSDPAGKDIVALIKLFGDAHDDTPPGAELRAAWDAFLEEHKHQISVTPMCGLIIHVLITYWQSGHALFESLPPLERMLLRDTVMEISEEIDRQSAANSNLVIPDGA